VRRDNWRASNRLLALILALLLLCVFCTVSVFAGLYLLREPVAALLNPAPLPSPPAFPIPTQLLATAGVASPAAPPVTLPAPTGTGPAIPGAPTPTPAPTGVWPPSGQIVYVCFVGGWDQICRMNGDGSNQEQLTFSEATDFYPEWGPLGLLIPFSSRRTGEFAIWLMNADGSDQRRVSGDIGSLFAPDISPDGRQIVFTNAQDNWQNIWIMDLDGSNARPLTTGPFNDIDPVWSPDGSQIAFASDRGEDAKHWVMDAGGDNMRLLPDEIPAQGGRSDWSPDGRWLAFYAGPQNDRDIYRVATDGSGAWERLTNGGGNLAPSYSPDGNWIAFTSYRAGSDAEIWVMRLDGSDPRQLTDNDYADWQPRWGE
jgi:Tol biopolymer transport system component